MSVYKMQVNHAGCTLNAWNIVRMCVYNIGKHRITSPVTEDNRKYGTALVEQ